MGFTNYLDDYEREFKAVAKKTSYSVPATQQVKKPAVILKRPVVETVIEEESDLDEYLLENEWKFRNNIWVDPITKNRLIYEAAYAVQQERDRLTGIMESQGSYVQASGRPVSGGRPVGGQPAGMSMLEMASSCISDENGNLYHNDDIAQQAMYSGKYVTPTVGDLPQQSPTEAFYGGEEARMLAEAEVQAFNDSASMSGVSIAPSRRPAGGAVMSRASALF